jgi:hypothetical protein
MGMSGYKTFASIRLYHEEVFGRVIRLGQDNPTLLLSGLGTGKQGLNRPFSIYTRGVWASATS